MKHILLAMFLFGATASAQTEVLKGYVNLDRQGVDHFVAVDTKTFTLTAALPLDVFFGAADIQSMHDCMQKKLTHVIFVDQVEAVQSGVPTGSKGQTTTHLPKYENVRCVPAEGFIETWREIVKQSQFH